MLGPDWISGLFSWIPSYTRFGSRTWNAEIFPTWYPVPKSRLETYPISARKSLSSCHSISWKTWGRWNRIGGWSQVYLQPSSSAEFMINFSLLRASLVTQMVKNLPAMRETCVQSDPWVGKIRWRRAWPCSWRLRSFKEREQRLKQGPGQHRNWLRMVNAGLLARDSELGG